MKRNEGKYPEVQRLPATALNVKLFCAREGYTDNWLYKQIKKEKETGKPFKHYMVIFQGSNYVIPKPERQYKDELSLYKPKI